MKRTAKGQIVRNAGDDVGTTRFVVSTDIEARDGLIVDQQSWILDGYRENPVVLWAHDYETPPIGRAVDIGVVDNRLEATVQWDTTTELGRTVAGMYRSGTLNAVSVGWRIGSMVRRSELPENHPHHGADGYVARDNEMLEFSAVPVPADRHALAIRGLPEPRPENLSLDEITQWVLQGIDVRDLVIETVRKDPEVRKEIERVLLSAEVEDQDWFDGDDDGEDWGW